MSYVSLPKRALPFLSTRHRGMSLMEVLVAVTIVTLIIGGASLTFVQLLRSHDRAQARVDATANARTAMEQLTTELKRARTVDASSTATLVFSGATETSTSVAGDYLDQDNDGSIDEEQLNGADDDNDWQLPDDRHAIFETTSGRYAERPVYYQALDLDDNHVDVDLRQSSATMTFSTFPVPPGETERQVRFYIGSDPDGEPHTLMKEVMGIDAATSTTFSYAAPVAHNVVSFGLLFWDEALAHDPASNPWRTEWTLGNGGTQVPASVYMTISVYAGTPLGLDELPAGQRIDTVTLTSVVDIESVLASPEFLAIKDLNPVTPLP